MQASTMPEVTVPHRGAPVGHPLGEFVAYLSDRTGHSGSDQARRRACMGADVYHHSRAQACVVELMRLPKAELIELASQQVHTGTWPVNLARWRKQELAWAITVAEPVAEDRPVSRGVDVEAPARPELSVGYAMLCR